MEISQVPTRTCLDYAFVFNQRGLREELGGTHSYEWIYMYFFSPLKRKIHQSKSTSFSLGKNKIRKLCASFFGKKKRKITTKREKNDAFILLSTCFLSFRSISLTPFFYANHTKKRKFGESGGILCSFEHSRRYFKVSFIYSSFLYFFLLYHIFLSFVFK